MAQSGPQIPLFGTPFGTEHGKRVWYRYYQQLSTTSADVTAQIAVINSEITTIDGEITTIQGDIATIDSEIATINGEITTIQGDITTIDGQITTINGEISAIQTELAQPNTQIVFGTGTGITSTAGLTFSSGVVNAASGYQWNGVTQFQLIATPPAHNNSAGTAGQVAYDSGFFYVCTATNTWARVAIGGTW